MLCELHLLIASCSTSAGVDAQASKRRNHGPRAGAGSTAAAKLSRFAPSGCQVSAMLELSDYGKLSLASKVFMQHKFRNLETDRAR